MLSACTLACRIPPGAGVGLDVHVRVGGQTVVVSNGCAYLPPFVARVEAASSDSGSGSGLSAVSTDGGALLNVIGSNFGTG